MSNPYRKYDGLSYRDITWRLRYQHLPEVMIDQTIASIKEWRAARALDKRRKRERETAWGEVISLLQHERRIVRAMLRYNTKDPAPERDEFVQAYFDALTRVYEDLVSRRNLGEGEPRRKGMPAHSHWTDYVPEKVKQAFRAAAGDIPHRQKAKFKEPFLRVSTFDLHDLRKGRLLRKTRKDLQAVEQRLKISPDDEQAKRKQHALQTAVQRITAMEPNAHVPNHWAEVIPELLVKNQTDEDEET